MREGTCVYRRALAVLGATTVAASIIAAGTMNAGAATTSNSARPQPTIRQVTGSSTPISPDQPWTIRYRAADGHITDVWHGTKAAADVLSARWRAAHSEIGRASCRERV